MFIAYKLMISLMFIAYKIRRDLTAVPDRCKVRRQIQSRRAGGHRLGGGLSGSGSLSTSCYRAACGEVSAHRHLSSSSRVGINSP